MVRVSIQDRALVHGAEAQLGSLYGTTLRLAAISMDIRAGIADLEDRAGIVESFHVERLNGHMRGTRMITTGYCSLTSVKRSPTGNSQETDGKTLSASAARTASRFPELTRLPRTAAPLRPS